MVDGTKRRWFYSRSRLVRSIIDNINSEVDYGDIEWEELVLEDLIRFRNFMDSFMDFVEFMDTIIVVLLSAAIVVAILFNCLVYAQHEPRSSLVLLFGLCVFLALSWHRVMVASFWNRYFFGVITAPFRYCADLIKTKSPEWILPETSASPDTSIPASYQTLTDIGWLTPAAIALLFILVRPVGCVYLFHCDGDVVCLCLKISDVMTILALGLALLYLSIFGRAFCRYYWKRVKALVSGVVSGTNDP